MKDEEKIRLCRLHEKPARAQDRELMIEERVYEVKRELRHRSLSDANDASKRRIVLDLSPDMLEIMAPWPV